MRRGLGGRHYKTTDQVQRRVGQIVGEKIGELITVEVGEHAGKPTIGWQRDEAAIEMASLTDGVYALATNLKGRPLSRARCCASTRTSRSSSAATATSSKH